MGLYELIKTEAWNAINNHKSRIDIDELINEAYIHLHDKQPSDKKIRNLLISLIRNEKQTVKATTSFSINPSTNNPNRNNKSYSDKKCNGCKEYLPVSEFAHYVQKNGHTKVYHLCVGCQKNSNHLTYIKNKESHNQKSREWRIKNKDRFDVMRKKSYLKKKKRLGYKDSRTPVAEINSQGIIVSIYPSLSKAAIAIGVNRTDALSIAIKNNRPYHGRIFKTKII